MHFLLPLREHEAESSTLDACVYIVNNGHIVQHPKIDEVRAQLNTLHRYFGV
jgi:hypothetical protein